METVFWGVLAVGVSVVLAVVGFGVARRLVALDFRVTHNANIAVMFGALYVVYGLVVGFSTYFVAYQYDTAQRTVETEAGSLEEIHRLAEGFPEAKRRGVQDLAESYARTVIERGWPAMWEGRVSAKAGEVSDELRRSVVAYEPGTEREDVLYAQSLELVVDLDEGRALRMLEVREGVPSILWVVLIFGGVITVCFTYLMGVRTERLHVFMIVSYTTVLVLILYTIRVLDYPFDSLVQVGPEAFEAALVRMEESR